MVNKKILDGWEDRLNRALTTGKGKFANCLIVDVYNYRRIISLMRENKMERAADLAYSLDTAAREEIPMTIWNVIEKEYYRIK